MRHRILPFLAAAAVLGTGAELHAKPAGPMLFCEQYPDSPLCSGGATSCATCHVAPPERNVFGSAIEANLLPGTARPLTDDQYAGALDDALLAIEDLDSDGDGFANLVEIEAGAEPGNALSHPEEDGGECVSGNPAYDVCGYDRRFAWKKVHLDFCGFSPSFEELEYFDGAGDAEQEAMIHDALEVCLDSEFWRGKDGVLWQLANRKIRPLRTFQGENIDYENDYNLFTWTQIDGHDAREVLTADYYVLRDDSVSPPAYSTASSTPTEGLVPVDRRAGLLTTRWTLFYNVMFTALPRTAAAQAYRAFLGADIARMEGLYPIAGEPVDYDAKGVAQAACAACHSTLDPLTYPFRNYNGIGTPNPVTYVDDRLEQFFSNESPIIGDTPESGYIFGQPVANLNEWADVAANSPQFADATVMDYWKLLVGRAPEQAELAEFQALSQSFRTTDGYSVEAMLHNLVTTEAYGAP